MEEKEVRNEWSQYGLRTVTGSGERGREVRAKRVRQRAQVGEW
jgi:hypothetical protein